MRLIFPLVIMIGALLPTVGYGQAKPESAGNRARRLLSGVDDGRVCGGAAGIKCEAGAFCDMPEGTCAKAGGQGRCVALLTMCFRLYRPVCGCDHQTYGNDCERQTGKVGKAHDGKCS